MFGLFSKKRAKVMASGGGIVPPGGRKPTLEPSVVASNVNVLGNIVSDGVLDIDGQIDGNVTAQLVTVRPNGRIRGDLIAKEAVVHGTVDGLIKAQAVSLFPTAIVNGTIMHETLMVEDGAVINGKLRRTEMAPGMDGEFGSSAAINLTPVDAAATNRTDASAANGSFVPGMPAANDTFFDSDSSHDHPTEKEMRILENLRLIS